MGDNSFGLAVYITLARMHTTLARRTNILFCGIWAVAALTALTISKSLPIPQLVAALALGASAGFLQTAALRRNSDVFRSTSSAMAVRRALMKSVPGKLSITLLWANLASMVILFWPPVSLQAIAGFYGCLCSFSLARDLIALPAVWSLGSAPQAQEGQHAG